MKIKGEGGLVWIKRDDEDGWYRPGAEEVGAIATANQMSWIQFTMLVQGKVKQVDNLTLKLLEPMGFPIEANGAANIYMHIEAKQRTGQPVDLDYVKQQALMTAQYMQQLEGTSPVQWFDFVKKFEGRRP